jgi:hypothetical protein
MEPGQLVQPLPLAWTECPVAGQPSGMNIRLLLYARAHFNQYFFELGASNVTPRPGRVSIAGSFCHLGFGNRG